MNLRKKLAGIGAGLLVIGAVTAVPAVVTAAPALAAGCWEQSCNGQNPFSMGCTNNVWTSPQYPTVDGYVQLYYSYDCNANWTVFIGCSDDVAYVTNEYGDYGPDITDNCGGYTAMVNGSVAAWGCVHVIYQGWVCTGKF